MSIDDIEKFEDQSLQVIAWNMCKWFLFDSVNINCEGRAAVESGIWITVKVEINGKTIHIDGQRIDIVKRRLIEWLRKHIEQSRK